MERIDTVPFPSVNSSTVLEKRKTVLASLASRVFRGVTLFRKQIGVVRRS
jgi:hypothetical protein